MGARQCIEMDRALEAWKRERTRKSVRAIAKENGVSFTGLYASIRRLNEPVQNIERKTQ